MRAGTLVRLTLSPECSDVFHGGCECLTSELARLQRENEAFQKAAADGQGEVVKLIMRIDSLELGLAGYGDHTEDCAWKIGPVPPGTLPGDVCDCGYSQLLKKR